MKIIFKILIIIIVASIVGGLFYTIIAGTSSNTNQFSSAERFGSADFSSPDRQDSSGGIQLPLDSIKNLLIISFVSLSYLQVSKWVKEKKPIMVRAR